MSMEHARQLNPRTRYSIVESKKIVLHQGDQTIILDEQDVCTLFVVVSTGGEEPEYDASKNGCQA